ncbi:hypothetical protein MBH78_02170 [Oceanimonas sp. NS1]|nr:hypothetical protein [Oceanimonas sp. NS1]
MSHPLVEQFIDALWLEKGCPTIPCLPTAAIWATSPSGWTVRAAACWRWTA